MYTLYFNNHVVETFSSDDEEPIKATVLKYVQDNIKPPFPVEIYVDWKWHMIDVDPVEYNPEMWAWMDDHPNALKGFEIYD